MPAFAAIKLNHKANIPKKQLNLPASVDILQATALKSTKIGLQFSFRAKSLCLTGDRKAANKRDMLASTTKSVFLTTKKALTLT